MGVSKLTVSKCSMLNHWIGSHHPHSSMISKQNSEKTSGWKDTVGAHGMVSFQIVTNGHSPFPKCYCRRKKKEKLVPAFWAEGHLSTHHTSNLKADGLQGQNRNLILQWALVYPKHDSCLKNIVCLLVFDTVCVNPKDCC